LNFSLTFAISDIIRQRTKDIEVKRYCVNLLDKFGSFEYTRQVLAQLDNEARDEVANLGGNPLMESLLDELLNWRDAPESLPPKTRGD
jgi:geranylgeranyl diphosphate synthase, type III